MSSGTMYVACRGTTHARQAPRVGHFKPQRRWATGRTHAEANARVHALRDGHLVQPAGFPAEGSAGTVRGDLVLKWPEAHGQLSVKAGADQPPAAAHEG